MSSDHEVRFRLPQNLHKKWSDAAAVRNLSLKAFISSAVSGVLIQTGELNPVTEVSAIRGVSAAKPVTEVIKPKPPAVVWDDDEPDMLTPEEMLTEGIDLGGVDLDDDDFNVGS